MHSQNWHTSPRRYGVAIERDVRIPVGAGIHLDADVFRPDAPGRFPAVLAVHAYNKAAQTAAMLPIGFGFSRGSLEAGDYNFYARRGYGFVVMNVRGTGKSEGVFGNYDAQTMREVAEAIEWLASQSWCDGKVAMCGVSYFSIIAKFVAALKPPALKALSSPTAGPTPTATATTTAASSPVAFSRSGSASTAAA
jgi:putative CocE/NonD family hydrolase